MDRYGCHSDATDHDPRGRVTVYAAHPWSRLGSHQIKTEWLRMACGHSENGTDPQCAGCTRQTLTPNTPDGS